MRKSQLIPHPVRDSVSVFEKALLGSQSVKYLSAFSKHMADSELLENSLFLQVAWHIVVNPNIPAEDLDVGTQFISKRCSYEVLVYSIEIVIQTRVGFKVTANFWVAYRKVDINRLPPLKGIIQCPCWS